MKHGGNDVSEAGKETKNEEEDKIHNAQKRTEHAIYAAYLEITENMLACKNTMSFQEWTGKTAKKPD